jgi:hypothetical protein
MLCCTGLRLFWRTNYLPLQDEVNSSLVPVLIVLDKVAMGECHAVINEYLTNIEAAFQDQFSHFSSERQA